MIFASSLLSRNNLWRTSCTASLFNQAIFQEISHVSIYFFSFLHTRKLAQQKSGREKFARGSRDRERKTQMLEYVFFDFRRLLILQRKPEGVNAVFAVFGRQRQSSIRFLPFANFINFLFGCDNEKINEKLIEIKRSKNLQNANWANDFHINSHANISSQIMWASLSIKVKMRLHKVELCMKIPFAVRKFHRTSL